MGKFKSQMHTLQKNDSFGAILINMVLAALSLFVNGFGIHLTIRANIGVSPWDVFNLGLSHTFGMKYGTASIAVSLIILVIDVLMREPIGVAMLIDSIVVGKSVDLFNYLDFVKTPDGMIGGILMTLAGLVIIGYTQGTYMMASLGCGPRDTLLVGLKRHLKKVPIGLVSIVLLSIVTAVGYFLGGPVGIGTIICAFGAGPIMQFAFFTIRFNAVNIHHQSIRNTARTVVRAFRKHSEADGRIDPS